MAAPYPCASKASPAGLPQHASTLNRSPSTCHSFHAPARPRRHQPRWSCRNDATCVSFSVMDSISIRARVSPNTFIRLTCFRNSDIFQCEQSTEFRGRSGKEKEKYTRGAARCLRSSIALHPHEADDSGQALRMSSNRPDRSDRNDFGGATTCKPLSRAPPKLLGTSARLLMASAPLPSTHLV